MTDKPANQTATCYQTTLLLKIFLAIVLERRRAVIIEAPDEMMKPGIELRIRPDATSEEIEHPAEIIAKIRTAAPVEVITGYYEDTGDPRTADEYLVEFDIEEDAIKNDGFVWMKPERILQVYKYAREIAASKVDYNDDREDYLEAIIQQNRMTARNIEGHIRENFPNVVSHRGFAELFGMAPATFSLQFTGIPSLQETEEKD